MCRGGYDTYPHVYEHRHALVDKPCRIDIITVEGVCDSVIFLKILKKEIFLYVFPLANYTKRLGPVIVGASLVEIFAVILSMVPRLQQPCQQLVFLDGRRFWLFSLDKRTAGKIQFGFDTDIGRKQRSISNY